MRFAYLVLSSMKRHVNIPIFIPHLGCPNQCVFCNQRTISGVDSFEISKVKLQIDEALSTVNPSSEVEIAFFGGSFTGIDRDLMISLLKIAHQYILDGRVSSIRCSTRPDYIDEYVLDVLATYGVRTIELGLQSSSDSVLQSSKRGHSRSDEERACRMIKERGFSLVGQMMIGLPGSSIEDEIETARFIVDVCANGARIYPTVVFYDTELHKMSECGKYKPLEIDDAIMRSAKVLEIFVDNKVEVIRIGLCSSENLTSDEKYYAGPNHPALGEMVESALFYNKIKRFLETDISCKGKSLKVYVAKGCISKIIGQKKLNKNRLLHEFGLAGLKVVEDDNLSGYELMIEQERKRECT